MNINGGDFMEIIKIKIELPKDFYENLELEAKIRGITVQELIRRLLEPYRIRLLEMMNLIKIQQEQSHENIENLNFELDDILQEIEENIKNKKGSGYTLNNIMKLINLFDLEEINGKTTKEIIKLMEEKTDMSKNTLVAYLSYLSSAGIIKVEHNKRVLTELGKKLLKLKKEGKI